MNSLPAQIRAGQERNAAASTCTTDRDTRRVGLSGICMDIKDCVHRILGCSRMRVFWSLAIVTVKDDCTCAMRNARTEVAVRAKHGRKDCQRPTH